MLLLLFSLLLLAFLLYYSDFFKVVSILSSVNFLFVLLGFCLWFFGLIVRTERWRYLLREAGIKVPFWQAAKVYVAGMFLSNITPAKVGDPLRSVLLKADSNKGVGSSLPSVFIERIFDVVVTVLFSLVGLLLFFSSFSSWILVAFAVYALVFGVSIYVIASEKRTKKFFNWLFSWFHFIKALRKFEGRVEKFSKDLHKSFVRYRNKKVLFVTFVYSLIVWLIEGLILFVSFLSVGIYIDPAFTTVVVAVTTLIAVLTFLPGGIGSSEAVTILIFTKFFSLTPAEVMSAAILSRAFGYWTYVVLGAVLIGTSKYSFE
jgi:hypothetical protein